MDLFDFWTLLCIGVIVTIILVILITVLAWKYLSPDRVGRGPKNPYSDTTAPVMAPGTHKSYITAQGVDAGIGPDAPPSVPLCPNCSRPGTFDVSRHNYYCGTCKRWF